MSKTVDLFLFMGQSNMAGRGITTETWSEAAPALVPGAGYEFRAVSDPGRLCPLTEPFGVHENRDGGIDDGAMKTGSMVTAFVNAYYRENGNIPIVGVSASKGGSAIAQWQPGAPAGYLEDAIKRYRAASRFLRRQGCEIRHRYMLWCQGETDGDHGTEKADYLRMFATMLARMRKAGIETCFMVQIGRCNKPGCHDRYDAMIRWQKEIAEQNRDVVLVSESFKTMQARGLMKDDFHYYQQAYNEVGTEAGELAARYVRLKTSQQSYEQLREDERKQLVNYLAEQGVLPENLSVVDGNAAGKGSSRYESDHNIPAYDLRNWKWVEVVEEETRGDFNCVLSLNMLDVDPKTANTHALCDRVGAFVTYHVGDVGRVDSRFYKTAVYTGIELPFTQSTMEEIAKLVAEQYNIYRKAN